MGNDPGNLTHVQAPWDPAQALRRPGPRLVESSTRPSPVDVFEQVFGIKVDDGNARMAKLASGVLSSVLNLPPIVVGEVLEKVWDKLKEVFGAGELPDFGDALDALLKPLPLDKMEEMGTARAPNVHHSGSSETGGMTGTSVAHETMPPPPPEAPRERNKCSSPSRTK